MLSKLPPAPRGKKQYHRSVIRIRPETQDDFTSIQGLNLKAFSRSDEARLINAVRQRTEPTLSHWWP